MQDLSYEWPHPRWNTKIGEISVRVHTYDNVYGLDPKKCRSSTVDHDLHIECDGLTWAGGEPCQGTAYIVIKQGQEEVAVQVTATHPDPIRCIAVTIHDLPQGAIGALREPDLAVPGSGRIVTYPNGWFDLSTPLLALVHPDGKATVARSVDTEVHSRRFAVLPKGNSHEQVDFELIVDAPATSENTNWTAPTWLIERGVDPVCVADRHTSELRHALGAIPWDQRRDVPDWMRKISLVVTIHGQHFTGRIFADYASMLEDFRLLSKKMDASRILAYLPGWEGRYYRRYGQYAPDPRMGGDRGFEKLVDGIHQLGGHLMPMFGTNFAARDISGFERWGAPGLMMHPSGVVPSGSVDWDGSRHFDHGTMAMVNPAFKPWRDHLVGQVAALHTRYGFDAAFFDISAAYINDPRGDTTQGLYSLVAQLREACPGMMVAGEGWFDAVANAIPLVQTGHRDNVPVMHDDHGLFGWSNRQFGHLNLGDPANLSTGVHEAGHNPVWRLPLRQDTIPTLSIVGSTLERAPDRVTAILDDAAAYERLYL